MNIYLLNVVFVLCSAILCKKSQKVYFTQRREMLGLKCFLAVSFFVLLFEMALRGDFSTDIRNYYYIFMSSSKSIGEFFQAENWLGEKDFAYSFVNTLVHQFGGTYLHLLFIIGAAISYSYVKFIRKYSLVFWLSLLILFCSGSYYTGFNVMRQLLAASLYLSCYKYIEEKNFLKYLFAVLLISAIHQSAIFMIPLYFLFQIDFKKKNRRILILSAIIFCVFAYIYAGKILSIVSRYIYMSYADPTHFGVSEGVGFLGTIKAVAMASGILLNYKKFDISNKREKLILLGTILYLIFAVAGGKVFIIQRFTHFFLPCLMIGYPVLLSKIKNRKTRNSYTIIIVVFFILTNVNAMVDNNYYFYWDNKTIFW